MHCSLKLSAEIADSSQVVKTLVIKAEDARRIGNMPQMAKSYSQLYDINRELIGEYQKRANNHAELLKSLKDVNQMIQQAVGAFCCLCGKVYFTSFLRRRHDCAWAMPSPLW